MALAGTEVTGNITANGQAVTANCNPHDIAMIQLLGTFVGTLQFEASVDGTNWVSIGTATPAAPATSTVVSATAVGHWRTDCSPYVMVRVRCSAYTSGTVNVRIQFGDNN